MSAQQNLLNNEQEAAIIRSRLITSVKALGGGWDAESLAAIHVRLILGSFAAWAEGRRPWFRSLERGSGGSEFEK